MEAKGPNFSQDAKRAAVELWKAKVPLKNIREQLQMSERTLRRVLAAAKASPEDPVPKRKKTSGRPAKVMATTLIVMRRHLVRDPTLTAGQLKALMPALANTSIRTIQRMCLEKLKLPSRKMAAKPLITQAMKDNSPDLNPIENVWAWMKSQLRDSKATSLPQLQREITELWVLRMDNIQYLKNLVELMPRRLQAVIDGNGNLTKY